MAKYMTYANAEILFEKIGQKFSALGSVYKPKGSVEFADLPATPVNKMLGWVYNITDSFTTTNKFVGGSGKTYPGGTNVVVVSTAGTVYTKLTAEELAEIDNPSESHLYVQVGSSSVYIPTTDTTVTSGQDYYSEMTVAAPPGQDCAYDVLMGTISEPDGLDSTQINTLLGYLD